MRFRDKNGRTDKTNGRSVGRSDGLKRMAACLTELTAMLRADMLNTFFDFCSGLNALVAEACLGDLEVTS